MNDCAKCEFSRLSAMTAGARVCPSNGGRWPPDKHFKAWSSWFPVKPGGCRYFKERGNQ